MNADAVRRLAQELADTAPLWRPVPFHDDPPWVHDTPALAGVLLSLDDETLTHLDSHPDELQRWMSVQQPALAGLFTAMDACHDAQPHAGPLAMPEVLGRDVPGRKWQQLLHFAAAADAGNGEHTTADVVEWCSGKAHLSRLVLRQRGSKATGATGVQAAHAIEWNAALCADGARLAQRDALPVVFHRADALHISATAAGLGAQSHALALHACGDLHVALLHKAALAGVAALDVAPCCYHLTKAPYWQPLSVALAGCTLAQLPLTRDDLRLAVQEAVTSSPRVIRQQLEMAAWRLGFDALQREIRGVNAYLPTPSRPARVLRDGFAAFCADLAAHHRLTLPAGVDHAHFLRQGEARIARVRRLELPRHACRRALEMLIVADRALFLAEHGYAVRVTTFCPRPLTPRNLLIQARRPAGHSRGLGDG